MKLFDFTLSGYEELLSMHPDFYREVYEMQEILKVQGKLSDNLTTDIQQVFFNHYPQLKCNRITHKTAD